MRQILFYIFFSFGFIVGAQETLPVYTDYLTDNVFLIHPAAAGIGNCSKIRLTGRQQWIGENDFPQLQTLSVHTGLGEKTGLGFILFNDKNGYHSQMGAQLTYAFHIKLGNPYETNQLSFAISGMTVRNTLDESDFLVDDPVITQQINSSNYFNFDAGMAYHYKGLSSYVTAKNIIMAARPLYNDKYESLNLRRYLASVGYYFSKMRIMQFEPSVMFQYVERTREKFVDFNLKAYIPIENTEIWGGLSYRRGFDNSAYEAPNYFTPVLGINFNKFVFSYSYTHQQNDVIFADGGFHQLTLGFDFLCKAKHYRLTSCPNLSNSL